MSEAAIVDITDVRKDAIRVYADQIRVGDSVFDVWGGTHPIIRQRILLRGKVSLTRDDYPAEHFDANQEMTIVPGDGDKSRALDKASSGSRQGYIETGRYSTIAEEREINPDSHADEEV